MDHFQGCTWDALTVTEHEAMASQGCACSLPWWAATLCDWTRRACVLLLQTSHQNEMKCRCLTWGRLRNTAAVCRQVTGERWKREGWVFRVWLQKDNLGGCTRDACPCRRWNRIIPNWTERCRSSEGLCPEYLCSRNMATNPKLTYIWHPGAPHGLIQNSKAQVMHSVYEKINLKWRGVKSWIWD